MNTTKDDVIAVSDPNARYIINPIRTSEQEEAMRALAGSRANDASTEAWMEEIQIFRERIRQEEIAR